MAERMNTLLPATALAAVLHELKNSLGHVTLLLDEAEPSDPVRAAQATCLRLSDRLTEILLVYRAGDSALDTNIDACDPSELIEDLRQETCSLSGGAVTVRVRGEAALDVVFLDAALVGLVLLDAVHNALVHARDVIGLGVERLDDGRVVFFVEDDGDGYPDKVLFREPLTVSPSARSTGLGLYFADAVASAHSIKNGAEGCVRLGRSALGGARFELVLP